MNNITIGRYKPYDLPVNIKTEDGEPIAVVDIADLYDGWIEGVRDDGSRWIMWLDAKGNPTVFYPRRDEDGGIACESIDLTVIVPEQSYTE